ncbi:FHA domain-containing protein [Shimia sp. MMG029]|uniref:FHA domain-containing protein n=1 Tax=Shimia sp. MMG029 TaxID=3021978 RepID=UPI0022FE09C6|nr:FHA domain-containing protein [Shimia sp. MMG029]MDA5558246.1 FHA domain-containing protein [Shimia sp. MMG029]
MKFIRDIIAEKTQAAEQDPAAALSYPLRLSAQDRTESAAEAHAYPSAATVASPLESEPPVAQPAAAERASAIAPAAEDLLPNPEPQVNMDAITALMGTQADERALHNAPETNAPVSEEHVAEAPAPLVLEQAVVSPDRLENAEHLGARTSSSAAEEKVAVPDHRHLDMTGGYVPAADPVPAPPILETAAAPTPAPTAIPTAAPAPAESAPQMAPPSQPVTREPALAEIGLEALQANVGAHKPASGRGTKGRVKTRLLGFSAPSSQATDPLSQAPEAPTSAQASFPVGWLVIVDGPGKGASFALFDGLTQIGRGEGQTLRLDFGDNTISRENHAAIAFDGEQRRFFFGHGGKANLVRLNGQPVLSTEVLASQSLIRIGETTLRFVALCGEEFTWSDTEKGSAHLG